MEDDSSYSTCTSTEEYPDGAQSIPTSDGYPTDPEAYGSACEDFAHQETGRNAINVQAPWQNSSRRQTSTSRARSWVFTLNNPEFTPDGLQARLRTHNSVKYIVFQRERGEEGTEHFQGYVHCSSAIAFNTIRNLIGTRAHVEAARGNPQQCIDYCTKDETRIEGPWEWGERPTPGKRTDIERMVEDMQNGMSLNEVFRVHPNAAIRYGSGVYKYARLLPPPPMDYPRLVSLYIGPTRVGKTYAATRKPGSDHEPDPDLFVKGPDEWWDGYEKNLTVLWDEFNGAATHVSVTTLLRITDNYRMQVPIKGGYEWLMATRIIFTTNNHPWNWYNWQDRMENYKALAHRFSTVMIFTERGVPPIILMDHPMILDFFMNPESNGYERRLWPMTRHHANIPLE